ncbi:MAG TPA: NAD-glutamate dehydrogenase domain-containing protein, partial [Trueperaceae bacterium]|nr:NAD-glutamate dehydrogenase domain-containing protein [Trueperaceae bacterium]
GRELARRYEAAFDEGYEAEVSPGQAVHDIANLEKLADRGNVFDLVNPVSDGDASVTLLIFYHLGRGRALSDVLPLLENLGFRVLDQNPYVVAPSGVQFVGDRTVAGPTDGTNRAATLDIRSVDVFRVQTGAGAQVDVRNDKARLLEALDGLSEGTAENDRLNRLVMTAGLTVRQVSLLRAYLMYYAQLNLVTSRAFVSSSLLAHPDLAALLVRYFEARFDPALGPATGIGSEARTAAMAAAQEAVLDALAGVSSLAEDQALRGLLDLMRASVRTSYYLGFERISFKLDSAKVGSMPEPRPLYEIAVSSRLVEGTHLRGGRVARGGIRWSDRPDDFRTEVLGLMKTQMTKNAVIVPVGSKGGFVLKSPPADRDALRKHVQEQYQTYIRGLLDLTDNLVDGQSVTPAGLVVYDEPDTYLVVAADKGTATFSDLANGTAAEYGFWLGDAFASGGSAGYDHKGMGITARGAWECVKRHFAEMGTNVMRDEFTVVGIGDMSGDVFGNGLIYTDRIRLQAAFNHMHVFIDPEPDAAASFAERTRLFKLPRSTWADYDRSLISEGGGVFDRSAKSIELSPQIKALLGTTAGSMSGQDLIKAVLRLPVDLLWNGGIGTYVKASTERNAEVGDSANDGVRIDGNELHCKVVGEGGNLGFTQLARIEYARNGGRNDTDAIHNSAGVDTSDHEVNIKICLQPLLSAGEMSVAQRDRLLVEMTDDVAALVLRDNDRQSQALSLALRSANADLELFSSLLDYLVDTAGLNPHVEYLPTGKQLDERRKTGGGLTRPELSVMLAYVKMGLYRRMLETDLPDDEDFAHYLHEYFPSLLGARAPEAIARHSLRREITATQLTNTVVDLLGMEFVHRAVRQNGATPVEVVRAALIAIELLDAQALAATIDASHESLPPEAAYEALRLLSAAVDGVVSWLLFHNLVGHGVAELLEVYQAPLRSLRAGLETFLPAPERRRYKASVKDLVRAGHAEATAVSIAGLEYMPSGIGVSEVARTAGV